MTCNGKHYCGVDCFNARAKETEKALRETGAPWEGAPDDN